RSAALAACERSCAGLVPRADRRDRSVFSGSPCFPVPKPKIVALGCADRGIELRRPPYLSPVSAPNASVPRGLLVALGCAIARASAPSVLAAVCLLRRGRARRRAPAATARCEVERKVLRSHLFVPTAVLVDGFLCHWAGRAIDPTPVLRVPKAENVRTDCQCD